MELSGELIAILTTILLGWMGYISILTIQNKTNLTALKIGETNLHDDMEKLSSTLKESFAEMKDDVKDQINKVNSRLDIFLKDEITVLKELAKK